MKKSKSITTPTWIFVVAVFVTSILFLTGCNQKTTETNSEATLNVDSPSVAQVNQDKPVTAPIVFNGTVKEGGSLKQGVSVRLYDKSGKELTSGLISSNDKGEISISVNEALNEPYILIADNGSDYYLESIVVAGIPSSNTYNNLDLIVKKYPTSPKPIHSKHGLFVSLMGSSSILKSKPVSYKTKAPGNTAEKKTGDKGEPAMFDDVSAAGEECTVYITGVPESPLVTFGLKYFIRKSRINFATQTSLLTEE